MNKADEELAVVLWVEQNHGDRAEVFIAEQIGAMALAGDAAGIEHWKKIAALLHERKTASRH